MRPLLICGFGPFPAAPANPAGEAVQALRQEGWRPADAPAVYAVIPTEWSRAADEALAAVRAEHAAGVLLVGVAVKATGFQLELVARNRADMEAEDAAGVRCGAAAVREGGPATLPTQAPAEPALEALRAHRIPAAVSTDAGAYLCNHTYYRLLSEAGVPVLLLHVPEAMELTQGSGFTLAEIQAAVKVTAETFASTLGAGMD